MQQQRQYRIRSYGVTTAHGDGQMLLPMNKNSTSATGGGQSNNSTNPQLPTTGEGTPGTGNLTHRHVVNTSQQNNSMASESQSRRVPNSTTNSTPTSNTTNSHRRSHVPGLQSQH